MFTEKQKQFCHEYIKDFNIAKAMVRVGYTIKSARHNGYAMLKNPEIAAYLKQLMDKINPNPELTAARVLEEIRRLAFADIKDYYVWSSRKKKYVLKPLDDLTSEQRSAISKYEPGEGYTLYDKLSALEKLGKHFKLFTELHETLHSFTMMPTITRGGKEHIFNVGKPKKVT